MNLRIAIAAIYVPSFIKKRKLKELFSITGSAFETSAPDLRGLSFSRMLQEYALFTKYHVERALREKDDINQIKDRLFKNAYRLGEQLAASLHVAGTESVMQMSRILYRIIGIDFLGNPDGQISINRCFFSRYYTCEICEVISSLDEGILAGLSGGGFLRFYQRITEGEDDCRALFIPKEKLS
jgi:hypothetical protein